MNCSKPTTISTKRLLAWFITIIITAIVSASVTALYFGKKAEANFFTQEVQETKPAMKSLGEYTITAYCGCKKCCGKWAKNRPGGIVKGASGIELQEGVSVASTLPFGTKIKIDGIGEYEVQDRIADWVVKKYDSKVIDVYFEKHEDAVNFGKQNKEIFIKKGDKDND